MCFETTVEKWEAISWPRVELEVRNRDSHDRSDLVGYGVLSVPLVPGQHQMLCHIWRPRGSLGERIVAFFMGGRSSLKSSALVAGIMDASDTGASAESWNIGACAAGASNGTHAASCSTLLSGAEAFRCPTDRTLLALLADLF